ncbi:MAG: serine/threonine-protein kinase [Cyanobacteria bacterium P01_F01_bin.86]
MNSFPDFYCYGYSINQELGANRSGGRVTYLATDINFDCQVVIKQFQFAKLSSSWSAYDAHQREIEVLQDLKHAGIPRYLDSFQVADGFCMVQEYKAARPLSINRSFGAEEIRLIAVKVLEILIYLQGRIPPIIHRDLKPENILVDKDLNVFLIDFGFARVGDGEVGVSSVVKGTLGFMPPEQLFNRQLTEASDLYGLGMTLICLLTNTKADDIGELVDISYKVRFKHLVPKLGVHWVKWLEKMTEPRVKERFSNAQEALKALPTSPVCPPEIQLSQCEVNLQAVEIGETLIHYLEIMNLTSDVELIGSWKIQKHPNDSVSSQANNHFWIRVTPIEFTGNQVQCCIEVDTSNLIADVAYHRLLVLQTNAFPETYSIPIHVQTGPIPIRYAKIPIYPLLILFIAIFCMTWTIFGVALPEGSWTLGSSEVVSLGLSIGTIVGFQGSAWLLQRAGIVAGVQLTAIATACLSIPTLLVVWILLEDLRGSWNTILSGLIPGTLGGWLLGLGMGLAVERLLKQKVLKIIAVSLVFLTSVLGVSFALGLATGFSTSPILLIAISSAIGLFSLLLNNPLNYFKRISDYRKSERNRIRP